MNINELLREIFVGFVWRRDFDSSIVHDPTSFFYQSIRKMGNILKQVSIGSHFVGRFFCEPGCSRTLKRKIDYVEA